MRARPRQTEPVDLAAAQRLAAEHGAAPQLVGSMLQALLAGTARVHFAISVHSAYTLTLQRRCAAHGLEGEAEEVFEVEGARVVERWRVRQAEAPLPSAAA